MGKMRGGKSNSSHFSPKRVARPPIVKAYVRHVGSAAEGNARWRYCGVRFCLNEVFLPSTQRWRRFEFRKPRQREKTGGGGGKGSPDSAVDPHTCVHSCRPFHACMHP
ncbi:hypothetical protein TNCT_166081 [Trichonephila clavata]|uniref:Uncharacterized protein n=1 Tax=Trichonephila clavata TaxID=2740835 RepID=A0A8X6LAU7_TRICU|nr:hypothetical protein TNCT_166081 [Trichonephila clavata]